MFPGLDGYGSSDKGEQIPVEPGVLTQKEVQFQKLLAISQLTLMDLKITK